MLGLILIGVMAFVALISPEYLQRVATGEKNALAVLLSDEHIAAFEKSSAKMADEIGDSLLSGEVGLSTGTDPISVWAEGRLHAVKEWVRLIGFRIEVFALWMTLLVPVVGAIVIDGYMVREIRKYAFLAQSPVRHKMAAKSMIATGFSIPISLFVPLEIPNLVFPVAILAMGCAVWLWAVNLQKRL